MKRKDEMLDFEIAFYENLVRGKKDFVDALIPLAHAYTQKGEYEKGLKIDRLLVRLLKDDGVAHYNMACSLALLGRSDEALQALRRALRHGYDDRDHMLRDSDLESLRKLPAFKKLLEKIK